ncbi:hypothetical protein Zm00014a_003004, partial [Zea mays]
QLAVVLANCVWNPTT